MQQITDVHAHILPGIDDGAFNMEEAEAMLWQAYGQGIRKIIATPHFEKEQDLEHLLETRKKLQKKAFEIHKQYRVFLGQEVFYYEGMIEDLARGKVLTMCGSKYALIEFSPRISYSIMLQNIRKIILARYVPIIAHMERYLCLREKGKVEELIKTGCILQMNYSSIVGSRFCKDIRWCRKQIAMENVHMMGTDMHHLCERGPEIKKALSWIKKHCGIKIYQDIVSNNAENILIETKQHTGAVDENGF